MIDFHCHSIFSDGELTPSELWQRARILNYQAIAITDHADPSNLETIIKNLIKFKNCYRNLFPTFIVGVELTHIPPEFIPELIKESKKLGAEIVVVHGETIVEPVPEGTNLAAILGGADILAHPGLIKEEEVKLAAEKKTFLEISGRKGHCFTNGHLVNLAKKYQAPLIINSDAHSPSDLLTKDLALKIGMGAGLSYEEVLSLWKVAQERFL